MLTANIFDIVHTSFVDGPGIRTTVFFKGCNLKCAWCHNPESQSPHTQTLVYPDHSVVCGEEKTVEEVYAELASDAPFYLASGGGVTFSGGECMLQIEFLTELIKKCRAAGIHTAVDTAGHVDKSRFERLVPLADMFLYDMKCMNSDVHKKYVGVGNEQILDNLAFLLKSGARVWVRVPVIPGVNADEENMRALREFYEKHGHPEKTELLPYHALGENKYRALGGEPHVFAVPEEGLMVRLRKALDGQINI